ncbi:hypothetical protein DFH08DRAFT_943043 [Mycena albidolilacea]|uniref:Uncharacterized protein n=1 Tax=Mycena albidolilacea TaxID=1033008 RepID=A0AAD6ZBH8_9AGAR|nr:hypothetical protein DFH08DRAFT_943043 [Mycena albidolilacea]
MVRGHESRPLPRRSTEAFRVYGAAYVSGLVSWCTTGTGNLSIGKMLGNETRRAQNDKKIKKTFKRYFVLMRADHCRHDPAER